jgi:transcriptional regulator with XRE-family HTH domain
MVSLTPEKLSRILAGGRLSPLRYARLLESVTQIELACELKVHPAQVSRLERSVRPQPAAARRFEAALDAIVARRASAIAPKEGARL